MTGGDRYSDVRRALQEVRRDTALERRGGGCRVRGVGGARASANRAQSRIARCARTLARPLVPPSMLLFLITISDRSSRPLHSYWCKPRPRANRTQKYQLLPICRPDFCTLILSTSQIRSPAFNPSLSALDPCIPRGEQGHARSLSICKRRADSCATLRGGASHFHLTF